MDIENVARGLADTFGTPGKAAAIVRDTVTVLRGGLLLTSEHVTELDNLDAVANRLDEMADAEA